MYVLSYIFIIGGLSQVALQRQISVDSSRAPDLLLQAWVHATRQQSDQLCTATLCRPSGQPSAEQPQGVKTQYYQSFFL